MSSAVGRLESLHRLLLLRLIGVLQEAFDVLHDHLLVGYVHVDLLGVVVHACAADLPLLVLVAEPWKLLLVARRLIIDDADVNLDRGDL